ncbi:MAG: GrpB family protein [Bacilli bacterium]
MDKITISDHKPEWEKLFIAEAEKIKSRIKYSKIYIDHVGSTAVSGLASKPIIDILINLSDWSKISEILNQLLKLDYEIEENCSDAPRIFLTKYSSNNYHIHICEPQSRWARDMIIFKNELLSDKELCEEYEKLKKNLADKYSENKKEYIKGKKQFIEERLRKAENEFGVDRLLSHQKAESNKAEKLQIYMMITQFIIALVAAISAYRNENNILFGLAFFGFLLIILWFYLSQSQQKHRSAGDHARRAALLISGLNMKPSPGQILYIVDMFSVTINSTNLRREENHFSTREAPSYKRLIEMIEESSYWTSSLQKASSKVMILILFILIAITFGVVGAAIASFKTDSLITLSRAIIAIMIFVISSDALGLLLGYKNSANAINEIFKRVEVASIKGHLESDALLLMSDYNAIIDKAPPTLPFVYNFIQIKLNKKWQLYIEEKKSKYHS